MITKIRFAAAISGASEADMFSAFGYDDLQRWIIYPGQSHSIRRPSYEVDRYRRYGYWYDKFLKGSAVDPTYDVLKKTTS